jgi:hypothetical protein
MAQPVARSMTTWTLYVADQVGQRQAQIDVYHHFKVIARYNAISTWELELPTDCDASDALLNLQHPRIVVRIDDRTLRSGPMTHLERNITNEGDDLSLTGVDDMVWLSRRIAHPQPATAAPPYAVNDYDVRTGQASQILAQYIDANAGPSAVPARRVPGLVVPVPAPVGGVVTWQARYENLSEFIIGKADALGLGVRVVDLSVDIFTPVVRSAVFSLELGTLAETSSTFDAATGNFVYVAGQGLGKLRTIVEVTNAQSVLDWGRVEQFQDRRDTNDNAQLVSAGNETLARAVTPPMVSFEPVDSPVQQVPRDWSVGDIVQVRVGDQIRADIVREAAIDLVEGAPVKIAATIGAADDFALFRASIDQGRRIRQLERV